jgi:hypothetical protein
VDGASEPRRATQNNGEDLVVEWSAPKFNRRNADEGRHRWVAAMAHHGAPQPTRRLMVAGENVAILLAKELTGGSRPSVTEVRVW